MTGKNRKRKKNTEDSRDSDDLREARFGQGRRDERGELRGGVKQVLLIVLALHVVYVIGLVIFNQFNAGEPSAEEGAATAEAAGNGSPESNGDQDVSEASANERSQSTYTIQSGDSLSAIARRYGISVNALTEANDMDINDILRPGTELRIPPKPDVETPEEAPSLEELIENAPRAQPAEKEVVVEPDLPTRTNPRGVVGIQHGLLDEADDLPAGQPAQAEETAQPVSAGGNTYKVQVGDTMWSISQKFDTTPQKLQDLNNISDPTKLSVGQTLKLPE